MAFLSRRDSRHVLGLPIPFIAYDLTLKTAILASISG